MTKFAPQIYVQVGRPKGRAPTKQPPNMPAGISAAYENEAGKLEVHRATAYARSDDAAVTLCIEHLVDHLFQGRPIHVHTTVGNYDEMLGLAKDSLASKGRANSHRHHFNAIGHYQRVLKAKADGLLFVHRESPADADCEAYQEAFREANSHALDAALKYAKRDPISYRPGDKINELLTWDGDPVVDMDDND